MLNEYYNNHFYEYLSKKIICFFKNEEIKNGDRFYIRFDDDTNSKKVISLYNSIKKTLNKIDKDNLKQFKYKHDEGKDELETFRYVLPNGISLVFVNSNQASSSYMVTLRNEASNQKGIWRDTALLIIYNDDQESIDEGARSLEAKDMPLNIKTLKNSLDKEIEVSDLSESDKAIVQYSLNKIIEDEFNVSIWDYEDIFSIIQENNINLEKLNELGLFYDSGLDDTKTRQDKLIRIQKNADNFEYVHRYKDYTNEEKEEKFSKRYDSEGIKKLSKNDWYLTDYVNIHDSISNFDTANRILKYEVKSNKVSKEGCEFWDRSKSLKGADKRKRNIIVFNDKNFTKINLEFKFNNDNLKRKNVEIDEKFDKLINYSISKNKLKVELTFSNTPTFYKLKYNHSKSPHEFNILILPYGPEIFNSIEDKFTINVNYKKLIIIDENYDEFIFGNKNSIEEFIITKKNNNVTISDKKSIKISNQSELEKGNLDFNLNYNEHELKIQIKDKTKKPHYQESWKIWKYKREFEKNFVIENDKAIQGNISFYLNPKFKEYINYEKEITKNRIYFGEIMSDIENNIHIHPTDIELSNKVKESYDKIFDYYNENENYYPSFTYLNNELKKLYENFLEQINNEIDNISNDDFHLSEDRTKLNLLKIGVFLKNDEILYSPLSPINIAYQLEIYNQCKNEQISKNILNRLIPNNLIPYIYGFENKNNSLFVPIEQEDAREWLIYKKSEKVSMNSSNLFIDKVVTDKMNDFVKNFSYLFDMNANAPIKINIVNINEDKKIVQGIINFIEKTYEKENHIIPVEINLYNKNKRSYFDKFFELSSPVKVKELFEIEINDIGNSDSTTILREIQNNITYYKHDFPKEKFEYAHLSFYKVKNEYKSIDNEMSGIDTGLTLNGLLSSVSSKNKNDEYRMGFGTKNLPHTKNLFLKTIINLNELNRNFRDNGDGNYVKSKSIVVKAVEENKKLTENLYKDSHWVIFVEPTFGLEYFDRDENDNLIIIHCSDQYTSSTKYDTIIVTNKSEQYKSVITEFLDNYINKEDKKLITHKKLDDIIKLFNSINGEWLLKSMIKNDEKNKDKISVISAIKYALGILDNKNIIWIPLSLGEILRIAGTLNLKKSDGIFDDKLLKGRHSDDLLFIGINPKEDIEVYFYPIEVKIGKDKKIKGLEQLRNTYKFLDINILDYSNEKIFSTKFYRNFFIHIALINIEKLYLNGFFSAKDKKTIDSIKYKLLNDEYEISRKLEKYIGIGAIISFLSEDEKTFSKFRAANPKYFNFEELNEEEIEYWENKCNTYMDVDLFELDAYYGLIESFGEAKEKIKKEMASQNILINKDINSNHNYE